MEVLLYRTKLAVDCALGGSVVAALFNLATVGLVCRAIHYIQRYQNYSVL